MTPWGSRGRWQCALCVKAPGFSLRRIGAIQPVTTLPQARLPPVLTGLTPGMDVTSFWMASFQASDARRGGPVPVGYSPWKVISLHCSFSRVPKHSAAALTGSGVVKGVKVHA